MVPSERVAAVVLVNKGVAFAGAATDAALAAVLPKYAESMAAAAANAKAQSSAPAAAAVPPKPLDSAMVGEWVGVVRAAGGDVPVQFTIAPGGEVRSRIGARSDSGVARPSAQIAGRLLLRVPGDLEGPNPAGMSREIRMYLDPRGAGFGGVITTRPPSATGLDGSVSYWMEIARRP
jgi:hypothetical protein